MPIDGLMPIMPQFTSGSGVDVANGCRLPGGWKESDVPVVFARSGPVLSSWFSFLRGRSFGDLLVPEAMMGSGPCRGNFSADDGSEAAPDHGGAHVNVNNEATNGRQRRDHVNRDGQITEPVQTPRNGFDEPESDARNCQQNHAIEHQPEE